MSWLLAERRCISVQMFFMKAPSDSSTTPSVFTTIASASALFSREGVTSPQIVSADDFLICREAGDSSSLHTSSNCEEQTPVSMLQEFSLESVSFERRKDPRVSVWNTSIYSWKIRHLLEVQQASQLFASCRSSCYNPEALDPAAAKVKGLKLMFVTNADKM